MKINVHPELCLGCEACMLVCSLVHEGKANLRWSRIQVNKDASLYRFEIHVCRTCSQTPEAPECIQICPTQAIRFNEKGSVIIINEDCIQCGACQAACQYQAIFFDDPRMEYYKCDLCASRPGPECVRICPGGALILEQVIEL